MFGFSFFQRPARPRSTKSTISTTPGQSESERTQPSSPFHRIQFSRMIDHIDTLSDAAIEGQHKLLDAIVTNVGAAWDIIPRKYGRVATEILKLEQERYLHYMILEDVITKHKGQLSSTKRHSLGFTIFEEWVWVAGLDEVIDLLGRGPENLLHAYEAHRLVLQGNLTVIRGSETVLAH